MSNSNDMDMSEHGARERVLWFVQQQEITVARALECFEGIDAGTFRKNWLPDSVSSAQALPMFLRAEDVCAVARAACVDEQVEERLIFRFARLIESEVRERMRVTDDTREQLDASRKENGILRALVALSYPKCAYCGLEDMSKCAHGFPGCSKADDIMCGEDEHAQSLVKRLRDSERKAEALRDGIRYLYNASKS